MFVKKYQQIFFYCVVVISTSWVFALPLYRGYFFGDDMILVSDAITKHRDGGFFSDLLVVGSDKWRPGSTPLLLGMARNFETNLVPFQVLSLFLLLLTIILLGRIVHNSTGNFLAMILITAVSLSSPFTWLIQSWTYGVMESLATLLLTLGLLFITKAFQIQGKSTVFFYLGLVLIALSSLVHERFLIAVIALWVFMLTSQRVPEQLVKKIFLILLVPLFHVIIKGFLLQVNPLTSGGEGGKPDWPKTQVLSHFMYGLRGVFGGLSGFGQYFSSGPFERMGNNFAAPILFPITVFIILLFTFIVAKVNDLKNGHGEKKLFNTDVSGTLLILVGAFMLIPGALVQERLEGRWIFQSQIFMIAGFIVLISQTLLRNGFKLMIFSLIGALLLILNFLYRQNSNSYFIYRNQVDKALQLLENKTNQMNQWNLTIDNSEAQFPRNWQFAYGESLEQLSNPPIEIVFTPLAECSTSRKQIPCLYLRLSGLSQTVFLEEIYKPSE